MNDDLQEELEQSNKDCINYTFSNDEKIIREI